ncbi:major facilitator superfamily domain-containing protein [Aspergillus bertholletiae]|uniref:Major facilitator superfamily domain-containing protein n=1 Tax=Aspergillus bertholletiae TaxID=1226010 RepID=A0A5N7AWV5_9EURO|nr:major facilitator superfamily domain-containing protein [Aspergillus bertholletiae]
MAGILYGTSLGKFIHWLSNGRLLRYAEEKPGFCLSPAYSTAARSKYPSRWHVPDTTTDGIVLVGWYSDDDPENPYNWPRWAKIMVYIQINFYTFVVYMSSAVFTPAEVEFQAEYDVPSSVGSLGMALVLLGYGIGPLLFGPLSDKPSIGRNPPYMISFTLFLITSILAAVVRNVPGFLFLRFAQGFFGSPCLATGPASFADITDLVQLPSGLWIWGVCAVSAPTVAPTLASLCVASNGWQWSMWLIVWFAAPCFVFLAFLPETSGPAILYQRARRLRALTGNEAFRSRAEITQTGLSQATLYDFLVIPWKINACDPAILFTTLYTALVYAIFYSFFEAVPLVYQGVYAMNLLQTGAIFLTAIVAVLLTTPFYLAVTHYTISRPVKDGKVPSPEQRLIPGLAGSLVVPAGMFLFAWTANPRFHWIVPTIGFLLFMVGMPTLLQSMFAYMSVSYGRYAGSLFAMNDFARSVLAFASILWSSPLYINLGIDKGASLIGALTVVCVFGIFILFLFGATLRKRSRFAEY